MKYYKTLLVTLLLSVLVSITTFSGQWRNGQYGEKWYQRGDGSYPANQWEQIDGNWYYFDGDGWMMMNAWIQGKYYVGDDGAMIVNDQTTDGFLVDSDGVYIAGSGNCIDGTYRFVKEEPIVIVDGTYVPGGEPYNGSTIEVKRISDTMIKLTPTGKWSYGDKLYKANNYGQSRDSTYFCTDDIEGISFRDDNLIIWPEDGDYSDYYVDVYEKLN